jgi:hypothetical protein
MVYTLTVHLTAKSDPECIRKLKNKLIEASRIYSKDKETVVSEFWPPRPSLTPCSGLMAGNAVRIRSARIHNRGTVWKESSQQYHLNNAYWKTFDPDVLPLLEKPMDLRRFQELDTSQDVKVD